MSRLAKKPLLLPDGVSCEIAAEKILVKGPKGSLEMALDPLVQVEIKDKEVYFKVKDPENQEQKSHWGLVASLVKNMVVGVTDGYEKKLEINGVGFRAAASGRKITLNVGFSHPVEYDLPEGINASVEGNIITLSGIDKQLVGETAARIRKIRKPEPYKGKGIKYVDEVIVRKTGKTAAKSE